LSISLLKPRRWAMDKNIFKLSDLATVVRSKNAGPFLITLDVFFKD